MLTASVTAPSPPLLSPGSQLKSQIKRSGCCAAVRISTRIKAIGLGLQLQPIVGRSRKQSLSVICAAAALNATCSASGQTQTVTREAPTITQAPVHCNNTYTLSILSQNLVRCIPFCVFLVDL
ncbi:hypothetical protein CRYUN_Cryun26dG0120700 [Craigia yunnanensis]